MSNSMPSKILKDGNEISDSKAIANAFNVFSPILAIT